MRWSAFARTGVPNGYPLVMIKVYWMPKENTSKWLIFLPLCSFFFFFLLTSSVHGYMNSCPRAINPRSKWPCDFSIHISKSLLAFFVHPCPLTLRIRSLSSAFFMNHVIFHCYVTIISIFAPSGLNREYFPSHQSVAISMYKKSYLWARKENSLLIWLLFSFKWWNKHYKWRKIFFGGLLKNAVPVFTINKWGTLSEVTSYWGYWV